MWWWVRVIFLDFDGPIIPARTLALAEIIQGGRSWEGYDTPCPTSGSLINRCIQRADAQLVISSSWRRDGYKVCREMLLAARIDPKYLHVDWATPQSQSFSRSREDEIHQWAIKHGVTEYVAIDDLPLDKLPSKHKVHVTSENGFLLEHYVETCEKLGVQPYDPPTVI